MASDSSATPALVSPATLPGVSPLPLAPSPAPAAPSADGEGRRHRVLGFTENQRAAFLRTLMQFGYSDATWSHILPHLPGNLRGKSREVGRLPCNFSRHHSTDRRAEHCRVRQPHHVPAPQRGAAGWRSQQHISSNASLTPNHALSYPPQSMAFFFFCISVAQHDQIPGKTQSLCLEILALRR